MRLEGQIKKLRQQAKLLKEVKHTGTQGKEKTPNRQPQTFLTTRQEEINQKILNTKGRLRKYWDSVKQYKQNKTLTPPKKTK